MGLRKFLGNSDELSKLIANLIRVGEVTSTDPEAMTARVRFIDRDNTESYDMQILTRGSLKDKSYHVPDIGENVVCLFLPSGVEAGFILGAFYPSNVERPAASNDVTCMVFGDGTRIEYNRAANNLLVDASASNGTVTVMCSTSTVKASDSVKLDTPETICTGNLSVGGNFTMGSAGSAATINGSVAINGTSLTHNGKDIGSDHKHSGVEPGGGTTGGPV